MGSYRVIVYVVNQRTEELGERMALEADSPSICTLVLRQRTGMAVAGIAIGLANAVFMSRTLSTLLFGISPFDLLTFIAGPLVFLAVAALACIIPARRAVGIHPAAALRGD